jgi:peptidoglycan/xylan/chitin deacetylase (PgdA/CDA1 family)
MDTAIISLTFDDGLRCQFERALPILDQYGFPATFFLITNTEDIHNDGLQHPNWRKTNWCLEDIELMKQMIGRGHEIGAHSMTHQFPALVRDTKYEVEKSKEWIEMHLGIEVASYCYPFCHVTPTIKSAVVKAGYKQARGGANSSFLCNSEVDMFNLDCRETSTSEHVNAWIKPGCWHILMYHGIGTLDDGWGPVPVSEFERQMAELAKFRGSDLVQVMTFRDGAEKLRRNI